VVDGVLVECTDLDVTGPTYEGLEDLMPKKKTVVTDQPSVDPGPQPTPEPIAGGSTVDGELVEQTDTHVTGPTYEGQPAPPPVDGPIPASEG